MATPHMVENVIAIHPKKDANEFAARATRIAAVATAADAIWEGIEEQLEMMGFSNAETGPLSMNLAYLMEQAEELAKDIAATR